MNKYLALFSFVSACCQAADPFEDFHEYGDMSEAEIHQLHEGELLYGDTEFGFIVNRGNRQSNSIKLRSNFYQDFEIWRNQFKFDGLFRQDIDSETGDREITASRFFASAQGNYKLTDKRASLFIYGDYEQNRFDGLEYNTTIATGYGNRLYQGTKNTVDFDIGPGLDLSRPEEKPGVLPEDRQIQRGYLVRVALQWERLVSTRTRFNQDLSIEKSLSGLNSRLKSETALISQVIGGVSLKAAYTYRYNTEPVEGKTSRDTELGVTLVYSF
ncbi:putative orphan protein [Pseudoalteromonas luteoviolacea B = ATCC 29581]|nr:putative orphan protein [Pseudoalteromonas luteoviolacea B = ATCC 29581]